MFGEAAERPAILIICGPTAIGKTAVAMAVQDAWGGKDAVQLISADSALIYREMDIGTAKPTQVEQQAYPHKLIDIRDPSQPYSVAEFVADADQAITEAIDAGKRPVVVGGTMMYLKCLLEGIASLPTTDPALREVLERELMGRGAQALHDELTEIDSGLAAKIHPNNHQRLLRAVAVVRTTGKAMSEQWQDKPGGTLNQRTGRSHRTVVMLPKDRHLLHQRIADRFDHMLQSGFLREVSGLMNRDDVTRELPSMRAVGYRQAWSHLLGDYDQAMLQKKGIAATRQLAKRQITWLRKWPQASVVESNSVEETIAHILG